MINNHVLMSNAKHFSNEQPINPYYHEESIDVDRAQAEHDAIRSCLEQANIEVTRIDAPVESQDGVYTANWALVRGKKAVLARLPVARKSEEAWAEQVLKDRGIDVIRVPKDFRFSGQGDALPCGDYLFCGSQYRSHPEAQKFAAEALGYKRIQLQTMPQLDENNQPVINTSSGWPDSFYYDIDLALSVIRDPENGEKGVIAYCPEAFTPDSRVLLENFDQVEKIIVSEQEAKEAFACNLVSTGEAVIMSAYAPQLKAAIESRGLRVFTPKITELAKGGGYIRCTTLTL